MQNGLLYTFGIITNGGIWLLSAFSEEGMLLLLYNSRVTTVNCYYTGADLGFSQGRGFGGSQRFFKISHVKIKLLSPHNPPLNLPLIHICVVNYDVVVVSAQVLLGTATIWFLKRTFKAPPPSFEHGAC